MPAFSFSMKNDVDEGALIQFLENEDSVFGSLAGGFGIILAKEMAGSSTSSSPRFMVHVYSSRFNLKLFVYEDIISNKRYVKILL